MDEREVELHTHLAAGTDLLTTFAALPDEEPPDEPPDPNVVNPFLGCLFVLIVGVVSALIGLYL